jgi:IclR family pca regulon transcriptional regulator
MPRDRETPTKSSGTDDAQRLRNTVQSLAKGFRVLEAFSANNDEMTLSEIALGARLDPGTTYRMLNTLVDLGYVARIPESRRYVLTLKVLDLGFHAIGRRDVRTHVRPVLRTLVDVVGEAASFAVIDGADVLFIERVRAGHARLGVDIHIGTMVPAARSAVGLTILAFLRDDEKARVMAATPRNQISLRPGVAEANYDELLADIRTRGHALMDSLFTDGLRILAVPVLDVDGHPIGAISIAAPAVNCSLEDLCSRALPLLTRSAGEISRALEAGGSNGFSL